MTIPEWDRRKAETINVAGRNSQFMAVIKRQRSRVVGFIKLEVGDVERPKALERDQRFEPRGPRHVVVDREFFQRFQRRQFRQAGAADRGPVQVK